MLFPLLISLPTCPKKMELHTARLAKLFKFFLRQNFCNIWTRCLSQYLGYHTFLHSHRAYKSSCRRCGIYIGGQKSKQQMMANDRLCFMKVGTMIIARDKWSSATFGQNICFANQLTKEFGVIRHNFILLDALVSQKRINWIHLLLTRSQMCPFLAKTSS